MKDGWMLVEYYKYLNDFFLQSMLDFDYLDDNKSTPHALTVIGESNA